MTIGLIGQASSTYETHSLLQMRLAEHRIVVVHIPQDSVGYQFETPSLPAFRHEIIVYFWLLAVLSENGTSLPSEPKYSIIHYVVHSGMLNLCLQAKYIGLAFSSVLFVGHLYSSFTGLQLEQDERFYSTLHDGGMDFPEKTRTALADVLVVPNEQILSSLQDDFFEIAPDKVFILPSVVGLESVAALLSRETEAPELKTSVASPVKINEIILEHSRCHSQLPTAISPSAAVPMTIFQAFPESLKLDVTALKILHTFHQYDSTELMLSRLSPSIQLLLLQGPSSSPSSPLPLLLQLCDDPLQVIESQALLFHLPFLTQTSSILRSANLELDPSIGVTSRSLSAKVQQIVAFGYNHTTFISPPFGRLSKSPTPSVWTSRSIKTAFIEEQLEAWRKFHQHSIHTLHKEKLRLPLLSSLSEPLPLVTVCIPTHARSKNLFKTVQRVIDSDYPNIEILIVDDGSEPLEFLQEHLFNTLKAEWKVLHTPHADASRARNYAAANSNGKYIFFFDDDDLLRPESIRMIVAVAERTQANIVQDWVLTFPNNEPETNPGAEKSLWATAFGASAAMGFDSNSVGAGSAALHSRDCIFQIGGYRKLVDELWTRTAAKELRSELLPSLSMVTGHNTNSVCFCSPSRYQNQMNCKKAF